MRRPPPALCVIVALAVAGACAPAALAKAAPHRAVHRATRLRRSIAPAVLSPAPVVFHRSTPAATVELRVPAALSAWPAFRAELYKADVAKLNGFLRQAAAAQAAAQPVPKTPAKRAREAPVPSAPGDDAAKTPTDVKSEAEKPSPKADEDAPDPPAKPDAAAKEASADEPAPPPFHRHARAIRYTVAGVSRRLVSVIRQDERDTGGAHPSADISGVIWDQRDHRRVTLSDLIRPEAEGALDRALCRAVKAAKAARPGAVALDGHRWRCPPWSQADAALAPSARLGAAGGLIVLIGPAEVGPYVEGEYRVPLSLAELHRALRPAYAAEFAGAPGPATLMLTGAPGQPPRAAHARPARTRRAAALH